MIISPDFPAVLKISHAHRGMGKVLMKDGDQFRDMATVRIHKQRRLESIFPYLSLIYLSI